MKLIVGHTRVISPAGSRGSCSILVMLLSHFFIRGGWGRVLSGPPFHFLGSVIGACLYQKQLALDTAGCGTKRRYIIGRD